MDLERRQSLYAVGLALGLLVHFSGPLVARWLGGDASGRPEWPLPGLIVPVAATAALLWLEPRRTPYVIGVALLVIGLAGWPVGWVALLLPFAWLVLAHSVSHWLVGLMAYSVAGFACFVIGIIGPIALGLPRHVDVASALGGLMTLLLFWPIISLWGYGTIGWVTPLFGGQ